MGFKLTCLTGYQMNLELTNMPNVLLLIVDAAPIVLQKSMFFQHASTVFMYVCIRATFNIIQLL